MNVSFEPEHHKSYRHYQENDPTEYFVFHLLTIDPTFFGLNAYHHDHNGTTRNFQDYYMSNFLARVLRIKSRVY